MESRVKKAQTDNFVQLTGLEKVFRKKYFKNYEFFFTITDNPQCTKIPIVERKLGTAYRKSVKYKIRLA